MFQTTNQPHVSITSQHELVPPTVACAAWRLKVPKRPKAALPEQRIHTYRRRYGGDESRDSLRWVSSPCFFFFPWDFCGGKSSTEKLTGVNLLIHDRSGMTHHQGWNLAVEWCFLWWDLSAPSKIVLKKVIYASVMRILYLNMYLIDEMGYDRM